jgi:hypothetical protein
MAVAVELDASVDALLAERADAAWELLKAGEIDPYDALLMITRPSEEIKRAQSNEAPAPNA